MVTLDLSRVDKKAQGPLELVSYWSHSKPHSKAQLGKPKRLAQLDNELCWKKHTEFYEHEMVCMLGKDFFILSRTYTHNWLRDHTSWALVELEWRLKVFSSAYNLYFWNSSHQVTLSYSHILKFTSTCYLLWIN